MSQAIITAVGGDPGPTAALAPVIELLNDRPWAQVECFSYAQAQRLWAERGLDSRALDQGLTKNDCLRALRENRSRLLLMGASYNSFMLELRFLAAAQEIGLPSLCLLDYPARYWARFSDRAGQRLEIPSLIAIGDSQTRAEMIAEGFAPERLAVTGLPSLDRLAGLKASFGQQRREQARRSLGAGHSDLLVLFASQPLRRLFQIRPGQLEVLGYDEVSVLDLVVEALDELAAESRTPIRLVLRPHPSEDRSRLANMRGERIAITLDDALPAWTAVCCSDLVVGMNSMLLMEACHLGAVTMSVQPGLASPDTLPTNRTGLSTPVYARDEVLPVMRRLLLDRQARSEALARLASLATDGHAAERVADLAGRLLGKD